MPTVNNGAGGKFGVHSQANAVCKEDTSNQNGGPKKSCSFFARITRLFTCAATSNKEPKAQEIAPGLHRSPTMQSLESAFVESGASGKGAFSLHAEASSEPLSKALGVKFQDGVAFKEGVAEAGRMSVTGRQAAVQEVLQGVHDDALRSIPHEELPKAIATVKELSFKSQISELGAHPALKPVLEAVQSLQDETRQIDSKLNKVEQAISKASSVREKTQLKNQRRTLTSAWTNLATKIEGCRNHVLNILNDALHSERGFAHGEEGSQRAKDSWAGEKETTKGLFEDKHAAVDFNYDDDGWLGYAAAPHRPTNVNFNETAEERHFLTEEDDYVFGGREPVDKKTLLDDVELFCDQSKSERKDLLPWDRYSSAIVCMQREATRLSLGELSLLKTILDSPVLQAVENKYRGASVAYENVKSQIHEAHSDLYGALQERNSAFKDKERAAQPLKPLQRQVKELEELGLRPSPEQLRDLSRLRERYMLSMERYEKANEAIVNAAGASGSEASKALKRFEEALEELNNAKSPVDFKESLTRLLSNRV